MDYRERWELKDYLFGRTLERRMLLFQVVLGVLLLGFLLNFWYLQGVQGAEYSRLAETNRLRRIPSLPTRGVIFDREREVIAATRPSLDLVLLRDATADIDGQLSRLSEILGTPRKKLLDRVERSRNRPAYEPLVLMEDLRLEQLAKIESRRESFPSLVVRETGRRSYPHGELFGHVLGYVGEVSEKQLSGQSGDLRMGDIVGKTGLERGRDDTLRGRRGWNLVSVNNLGRRVGGAWIGREPDHGTSVRLTLDLRLQRMLHEALGDEVGAGVFLDPWTGEVLALVSTPSFDPNQFADGISSDTWQSIRDNPRRPLHDRAIASYYAPGSVFKVLMAVAGLEAGVRTPGQVQHCGGQTSIYGRRRLCWKRGGHGSVDLHAALAHSCNVYFYHLGKDLGIDEIQRFSEMFRLGGLTGVDLPGEEAGVLPSRSWKRKHMREMWYPGDTISVAIGQGLLAVTPIQMASMLGAVATGGVLARPHVVTENRTDPVRLDVDPATLALVREALREAVVKGTARAADLDDVAVAGKTGTAQVYKHSAGIDSDLLPKQERDHAWFAGFAPADRPRIAFAIVVEHGGHGGSSAAPIARKVLEVFFSNRDDALRTEREEDTDDVRPPPAG